MAGNFLVPVQFVYGHMASESMGAQWGNSSQALALALPGDPPGVNYVKAAGNTSILEAQGNLIQGIRLDFQTGITAETSRGQLYWMVYDAAGGVVTRSVQTVPTLDGDEFVIEAGSILDGLVADGIAIAGEVRVANRDSRGNQKSSTVGTLFTDSIGDIGADLLDLDKRIRSRQGSFQTPSGVTVKGAAAGFVGATADVWVGPGDIGNGNDQIPNDLTLVTSDHLENFPGVFLRRTDALRGIDALNATIDGYNIEEPAPLVTPGPDVEANFEVWVFQRDPTYCAWRIHADGGRYDVILKVPDSAIGARNSRDLYEACIGSMLATDGSLTSQLFTYDIVVDQVAQELLFRRRGLYRKMGFIESAEFLGGFDSGLIGPGEDPIAIPLFATTLPPGPGPG